MENKNFKFINGTVTSPLGFTAQGVCASIKPSNTTKRDLALIYCEKPCTAAAKQPVLPRQFALSAVFSTAK